MISKSYSQVDVVCYSGYRGEEQPRRFTKRGETLHIAEILDRWLDPNHRYFKVLASDDAVYILRHDTNSGVWEETLYLSGRDAK
jgi:hypothetical protein